MHTTPSCPRSVDDLVESIWELEDLHRDIIRQVHILVEHLEREPHWTMGQ